MFVHVRPTTPVLLAAVLAALGVMAAPGSGQPGSSPPTAPAAGRDDRPAGPQERGDVAQGGAELATLRTANSRTYRRPGGNLVAKVFSDAVNYRKADGTWAAIDNELRLAAGGYENVANEYSLRLPEDASGAVSVREGEDSVSFALVGAGGAAEVAGNEARYAGALPGVTLAYSAESSSVKETLTLRDRNAPSSFEFRLETSPAVTAREAPDGAIEFTRDGRVVFRFVPPFMQDQTTGPAGVSQNVRMDLTGAAGDHTVRLSADREWLQDPARRYPVVIDPIVDLIGADQDCYLVGGSSANTNFCQYGNLNVGFDGTRASRSLLKFDLQGIIPRDAQVLHSELGLFLGARSTSAAVPVTAHRVTRAWSGSIYGATWNRYDGTNLWTSPGGDFTSAVAATNPNASAIGWQFWHPTELTQAWVDGSVANHGLLLKTPENASQTLQFDSTYTRYKTPPYLSIEYEPRAGDLARYWLEGQTVQEGLQLSVNPANGNLLVRQTDFQLSESDLDYGIERFYNNLSPNTGTTGGGWTMNVGQDVGLLFYRDGSVAFDGPSGYTVPFNKQADGSYEPAPGVGLELDKNADGTYTITDSETDDTYSLNGNGYLTRKTDQDGGQVDYTYTSGRLTSLSDNLGRRFTFSYDQFGFLARMTDASNGIHQYTHDSKGRLLAYTNPAGASTTFAYDSLFNLVRVTPPAGARQHRFTYDSSFRVTSDTEVTNPSTGTGPKTTWSYGVGTTTRTEPSGRKSTYSYDNTGMVTASTGGASPPSLTLSGTLHGARNTTLSPSSAYAMHYDASEPSGIAQAVVYVNREDVSDGGDDCVSACGGLAGDLDFDPTEEGEGEFVVRTIASDTQGDTRSQTFRVDVPTVPPPPELPAEVEPAAAPDEPIAPDLCELEEGVGSPYCAQEDTIPALASTATAPPAGAARLVYGISDPDSAAEDPAFADRSYLRKPLFESLRVKTVRIILPYNLMEFSERRRSFNRFYKDALDRGYSIMVSFQFRCTTNDFASCYQDSNFNAQPPSYATYVNLMNRFVRRFPRVRWISAWNEPNHRFQPVRRRPQRAANYTYLLDRDVCSRPRVACDVVAADIAQSPRKRRLLRWLRPYRDQLKQRYNDTLGRTGYPRQWGFHPYTDVRRERQSLVNTGTHAFMTAIGRDQRVWFSEAGSRIDFAGQARPRNTLATQAREVRYLIDRLALYRGRVDRVYYYQFCAGRSHVHDSGLTGGPETTTPTFPDCTEGPRPAYEEYKLRTLLNPK